jgi:hypothetical protein
MVRTMAMKKTTRKAIAVTARVLLISGLICLGISVYCHVNNNDLVAVVFSIAVISLLVGVILGLMGTSNGRDIDTADTVIDVKKIDKIEKPNPRIIKGWRDLTDEDTIQLWDQWLNADWEVGGPWFTVKEGNEDIGTQYVPAKMRKMRRPIYE